MKQLGKTDLSVSPVCLGTDWMGWSRTEADAFRVLDAFRDAGGNFLDTANVYGRWAGDGLNYSEICLGRWLASRGLTGGSRPVIATKGAHYDLRDRRCRVTEADIRADVESSLKALGTDALDLYYLHRDDPSLPPEEILSWLDALVGEGKLRYYAASNFSAARLRAFAACTAENGSSGFAAVSNQHSLAQPNPGRNNNPDPTLVICGPDELVFHRETGTPLIPFQSTARGYFAKRAAGLPVGPVLSAAFDNGQNEQTLRTLTQKSAETGLSVQTLTVTGLAASADGYQLIPVVGVNSPERMRDVAAAMEILKNN
ncbi:MAG: aldo/keto reductase [Clostridia bacterium]|nr:aldo/keto reductase [Clostridia bacterium]